MKIAVIGHRNTKISQKLKESLKYQIKIFLKQDPSIEFLFGSKSNFDAICLEIVTELKQEYPLLKRIYVRSSFQHINKFYSDYLLTFYDETYFPPQVENAGKASYIKRNEIMIKLCDVLLVYYDPVSVLNTKSGTRRAVEFAIRNKKPIFNFFE